MPADLCIAPLYKLVDTSVYSRPTYTCVSCRPMYEFYMYTVYRRVWDTACIACITMYIDQAQVLSAEPQVWKILNLGRGVEHS